jgi:hypothetical protein
VIAQLRRKPDVQRVEQPPSEVSRNAAIPRFSADEVVDARHTQSLQQVVHDRNRSLDSQSDRQFLERRERNGNPRLRPSSQAHSETLAHAKVSELCRGSRIDLAAATASLLQIRNRWRLFGFQIGKRVHGSGAWAGRTRLDLPEHRVEVGKPEQLV